MSEGLRFRIYKKDDPGVERVLLYHVGSLTDLLGMLEKTNYGDMNIGERIDSLVDRGLLEMDGSSGGYNLFAYRKV
jgi:hypothetical protein